MCNGCFLLKHFQTQWHFFLGDLHRYQKSGKEQILRVEKIIKHKDFNKKDLNNDIALLKLTKPAKLDAFVRTVCLPKQEEHIAVGSTCYISGKYPAGKMPLKVSKITLEQRLGNYR